MGLAEEVLMLWYVLCSRLSERSLIPVNSRILESVTLKF